jgi:hypothetical protein
VQAFVATLIDASNHGGIVVEVEKLEFIEPTWHARSGCADLGTSIGFDFRLLPLL